LVHPSPRCAETAAESLDLFLAAGEEGRAALSRVLLAVEFLDGSAPDRFDELLAAAEDQFDASDDAWGHAVVAFVRLQHFLLRGDRLRARTAGRAARDAFSALDDLWGLSAVLYHLGWGLREFGDYAESVAVLEEAIEVAESAGLTNTAQWAIGDLGLALLYLGENDAAEACFGRARAVSTDIGDAAGEVLADYGLAVRARMKGGAEAARPLYTRALDGFRRLGTAVYTAHAGAGLAWCDLEQKRVDSAAERYAELREVGESLAEHVLVAIALEGQARVEALQGDPDRSAGLLSEAAALRSAVGRPAAPPEQTQLDPLLRELQLPGS
jgi:tetratricopeptide (TPR) repeat protein